MAENLHSPEEVLKKRAALEKLALGWEETTKITDMEVIEATPRSVTYQLKVRHNSVNLRGFSHGGYLFTLCDIAGGCIVYSNLLDCVTLNGSVNYLRGAKPGDVLTVAAKAVHWGRSTKVIETSITNQKGEALVHATTTMYVIGNLEL